MAIAFFEKITDKLSHKRLTLAKGESLFKQKDDVANIFYIKSGRVQLTRNTIDGTSVILHTGQQGETIAEASLFSDHYHCSAIATLPSQIHYINKNKLLNHLEENPSDMQELLSVLASQVRDLRAINEIKNIRSANERILTFIRNNVNNEKVMVLDSSLKDIAHKIGLTHETFYRELKKLINAGIIIKDNETIKLV